MHTFIELTDEEYQVLQPLDKKIAIFSEVAKLVEYDPNSGIFTWLLRNGSTRGISIWNTKFANKVCDSIDMYGYRKLCVTVFGKLRTVRLHRLAWFITHGELPLNCIDHINQDKTDNRICNLRDVTQSVNCRNKKRRSDNTSGVTGVSFCKKNKQWRAVFWVNGKHHCVGFFDCKLEAELNLKSARAGAGFTVNHGSDNILVLDSDGGS